MAHPTTAERKRILKYDGHLRLVIRLYDVHILTSNNKYLKKAEPWEEEELFFMIGKEIIPISECTCPKEPITIDNKIIDGIYTDGLSTYYISIDPDRNTIARYQEVEVF